jgi:hypothetical protein
MKKYLIFLFIILFAACTETPKKAEKKELVSPEIWAGIETAVKVSLEEHLIEKMDIQQQKIWIKEAVWELVNAEVKERTAKTFATYFSVKKNQEYRSATIIGWQSGKKLASYTSWSGFKVY